MEEIWMQLLKLIARHHATDVHMSLKNEVLHVSLRSNVGIVEVKETFPKELFHYLKFMANLDLGSINLPQSGQFSYVYHGKQLHFRFSFLQTLQLQTAVLRVLNNHERITLEQLSKRKEQVTILKKWCLFRSGLYLISGPTGSGKTTTLHALLENISANHQLKVITLEDPVEIQSDSYLQLQINERMNFTYEEGIRQLLRHDPDVIMIGEIRDASTAQALIRCALSGHMVFTTLHAKSCKEAILRLLNFGVKESDLKEVLSGLTNQRIYASKNKKGRVCIYEIMEREEVCHYFEKQTCSETHKDIFAEVEYALQNGWISKKEAQKDSIF